MFERSNSRFVRAEFWREATGLLGDPAANGGHGLARDLSARGRARWST